KRCLSMGRPHSLWIHVILKSTIPFIHRKIAQSKTLRLRRGERKEGALPRIQKRRRPSRNVSRPAKYAAYMEDSDE
ncbi:hypothetical protein PMAYCL1PPCAC_01492, partial [Pristionchus mayeri]